MYRKIAFVILACAVLMTGVWLLGRSSDKGVEGSESRVDAREQSRNLDGELERIETGTSTAQAEVEVPEDREETPEEIVSRYQGRDDLTIEEIIKLGTAMGRLGPKPTRGELLIDLMRGPHATAIARDEESFQALQKEIDVILSESMDALLTRMPMANRDFAPPGLVLRHVSDDNYLGPGEDRRYGMKAYDLIFSNRRMLRVLDMLEEDADPALRTQIVESMRANFEYYRDWFEEEKEPGTMMPYIYSSQTPGTEPMLHASLLTALGLALVAAEHNITEAHPVILEMARRGLELRPELDERTRFGDVNLYNRTILSQALAGTAVAGMETAAVLETLGVPLNYRKIGRADTVFTPQESLHWRVPPFSEEDSSRQFPFVPGMDDDTYLRLLQHFEATHGL